MKVKIKAYMSKEAFFELPSAEQKKKAEKYDVYKKYLQEGKNGSKKAVDKKSASKPAKKAIDKKTAQAIKEENKKLIELTESLRDLKFEQAIAEKDGDEESVDSLQQEIDELIDSINSSKARIKDLRTGTVKPSRTSDNSDDAVLKRNVKKVAEKVKDLLGKDAFGIVSPKEYAKETISDLLKSKSGWNWIEEVIEPSKKDKDDTKVVKLLLPDNVLKRIHDSSKSEFSKFKSAKSELSKLRELYDKADTYYSEHRNDSDAEKAYEAADKKYKTARSRFLEAAGLLEESVDKILKKHKSDIAQYINEV